MEGSARKERGGTKNGRKVQTTMEKSIRTSGGVCDQRHLR